MHCALAQADRRRFVHTTCTYSAGAYVDRCLSLRTACHTVRQPENIAYTDYLFRQLRRITPKFVDGKVVYERSFEDIDENNDGQVQALQY